MFHPTERWGPDNSDPYTGVVPTFRVDGGVPLFILSGLYGCGVVFSLLVLVQSRPVRWRSFRSGFLLLSAASNLLRFVLTVQPFHWTPLPLIIVYMMTPIYFQFLTFSLLIVFLARCLLIADQRAERVTSRLSVPAEACFPFPPSHS